MSFLKPQLRHPLFVEKGGAYVAGQAKAACVEMKLKFQPKLARKKPLLLEAGAHRMRTKARVVEADGQRFANAGAACGKVSDPMPRPSL